MFFFRGSCPSSLGAVCPPDDNDNLNTDNNKSAEKEDLLLKRYLPYVKAGPGERPSKGIYLSNVKNLNLSEFILARKLYCKFQGHGNCWKDCKICSQLINLANTISEEGICQVSTIFRKLFNQIYQSDKAIRKLMHLPVAVFEMKLHGPGSQRRFVAELQPDMNYTTFSKI